MPHDDPHGPIVLFGLPAEAREAVFEALRSAGVEERFVHTASLDELVDNGVQLTDVVQELVDDAACTNPRTASRSISWRRSPRRAIRYACSPVTPSAGRSPVRNGLTHQRRGHLTSATLTP